VTFHERSIGVKEIAPVGLLIPKQVSTVGCALLEEREG
jgi:hypothetical protein